MWKGEKRREVGDDVGSGGVEGLLCAVTVLQGWYSINPSMDEATEVQ